MVKSNKYSLAHMGPFRMEAHKEMRIVFALEPQPICAISFAGTVYDSLCGHPIEAATVRLYDADEKLLSTCKTNVNGEFIFEQMERGQYFIAISANGYLLTELIPIEIKENQRNSSDFSLNRNTFETFGIIYGRVVDSDFCSPIKNSEVFLVDEENTLYGKTITNSDGQFLIYNIEPANYSIYASHPNYKESLRTFYKVYSGTKIRLNFSLSLKRNANHSIEGRVLRQSGMPAAHVPVFLFQVKKDYEKLMKTQLTNGKGLFYFDDLQAGDYIVSAKITDKEDFWEKFTL